MSLGGLNALRHKIGADLRDYLAEVRKVRYGGESSSWRMLGDFPAWSASLSRERNPIDDEWPWLTFGAIRRIDRLIRYGSAVFEYGAGGSTLYFLRKGASVVTVEHDPKWLDRVATAVRRRGYGGWNPLERTPVARPEALAAVPEDPDGYVSSGPEFRGLSFERYASSIDVYDDETFDLVVLDGRARPSCGRHAHPKVKPGGHLVLDNAERTLYAWIAKELAARGWKSEHFYGPGPYNRGFWQTSIFGRPLETLG